MPMKSSNLRVVRWPKAEVVLSAAAEWAANLGQVRQDVVAIGYIGSYARGDWGVGSDLDLIIVVDETPAPFHERAITFDALRLPVPCDLLVYTKPELDGLSNEDTQFGRVLRDELKWLWRRSAQKQ